MEGRFKQPDGEKIRKLREAKQRTLKKPDGKKIKKLREAKWWTQKRLAEATKKIDNFGVSKRTIERAEDGKTQLPHTLSLIAQALGVPPEMLVLSESQPEISRQELYDVRAMTKFTGQTLAGLDGQMPQDGTSPVFADIGDSALTRNQNMPSLQTASCIRLFERGPAGKILRIESSDRLITIGRASKNTVHISDDTVSWEHGQIILMQGGYFYRHLSKTNPSILSRSGEKRLLRPGKNEEVLLQNQDRLTIGSTVFIIEFDLINEDKGYTTTAKVPGEGQ
jgi:transcriptional regulator with XRE-family HTH domain